MSDVNTLASDVTVEILAEELRPLILEAMKIYVEDGVLSQKWLSFIYRAVGFGMERLIPLGLLTGEQKKSFLRSAFDKGYDLLDEKFKLPDMVDKMVKSMIVPAAIDFLWEHNKIISLFN